MTVQRMDHVGVVVEDLAAAKAFFVELGLNVVGEWQVEDAAAGRIVGLEGVRSDVLMLATPDGHSRIELSRFLSPPGPSGDRRAPSNAPGLRHLTFAVDDLDGLLGRLQDGHGAELVGTVEQFGGTYRLCYLRGPEGIIVELAEKT